MIFSKLHLLGADIVGHGLFDPNDSMASAMILGGSNPRGVIRAADIATMKICLTQNLSPCQDVKPDP